MFKYLKKQKNAEEPNVKFINMELIEAKLKKDRAYFVVFKREEITPDAAEQLVQVFKEKYGVEATVVTTDDGTLRIAEMGLTELTHLREIIENYIKDIVEARTETTR